MAIATATSGKRSEMTPSIKLIFFLLFLTSIATRPARANEGTEENQTEAVKTEEEEAVSKSVVADPPEVVRSVQIPVFKNGKWSGYREEALETERKPASTETTEAPLEGKTPIAVSPDEPSKPDALTPSP